MRLPATSAGRTSAGRPYYHYYTGEEWRDAAGYDLSLDSQQLGEDGCVELIRNALPLFT